MKPFLDTRETCLTIMALKLGLKDHEKNNNYVVSHIILAYLLIVNSFMTEAVIIYKPVHLFAEQINGLVSI